LRARSKEEEEIAKEEKLWNLQVLRRCEKYNYSGSDYNNSAIKEVLPLSRSL
jgi:hypothetical protein